MRTLNNNIDHVVEYTEDEEAYYTVSKYHTIGTVDIIKMPWML